ncbi:MAG: 2-C-methyl-D-erythritol 4-phosphate cytidylyltransferase [Candidatus Nanopelagicales bacterium]|nr:2-C-methyl-D-erythritol 4-phosphate cytidylyltransferase [Candidatus Nanopelagicales bacterium]
MGQGVVGCLLLAAGSGNRLGAGTPKALANVGGDSLLAHALRSVLSAPSIRAVVVTAPVGYQHLVTQTVDRIVGSKSGMVNAGRPSPAELSIRVITGGVGRGDSVALAEQALSEECEFVLVHDSARALTPPELFEDVVAELVKGAEAVVPAIPMADTVKSVRPPVVDSGYPVEIVDRTLDRARLRATQTPQGFRRDLLVRVLADHEARAAATDDASLVEAAGGSVRVIPGHPEAFKITYPLDVLLANAVIDRRQKGEPRCDDDGHGATDE